MTSQSHIIHQYSVGECTSNGITSKNAVGPAETEATKHKQMDQHLGESEHRFRCLVENAAVAICIVDMKGRFTYVNTATTRLLGYSIQELLGHAFRDFLHPDDRDKMVRLFIKTFGLRRQPPSVEFRGVSKDGHVLHLMTKPTKFEINGKTVGFQAVIVDITEQKKAEKAIRENQQKFERLFKGNPEAAVYWDADWRILDANPRFTELFGYPLAEIKGKSNAEVIVPENKLKEAEILGKMSQEGYIDYDTVRKRKDGSLIPVSMSVAPIIVDGRLVGYVGLYKDITARKKAEEEAQKSEERYKSLFENARDVILTADLEGNVTSINKAIEEYGWKREEIIGKNMLGLMSKESWPSLLKGIEQIAEGRLLEGEIELATPIGKKITEYKSNPIVQNNRTVGVQVIGRDITERKLMETRLSVLNFFAGKLNAANSLDEIYRLILDAMEKTLGFEYAEIDVIDKGKFRVACQRGYNRAVCDLPLDGTKGGIIVRAARSRKTVLVHDVKEDPDYVESIWDIRSEIVTPITATNEVLGVLNVESKRIGAFNEKDAMLLEILASHAATTISNLRKRSQIETALGIIRESEEKYRNLFENAQDIIVTIDLEGKITSVNRLVKKYGYDRKKMIGESVFELIPEEDWLGRQRNLQELAQGRSTESEFKIKTLNNSDYAIVDARSNPIIQGNKIVGAQTILRDITERKELERKLRQYSEHLEELVQKRTEEMLETERRCSILLDQASDGVVIVQNGKMIYANKKTQELFGYPTNKLDSLSILHIIEEFVEKRNVHALKEMYERKFAGGHSPVTFETTASAKNGECLSIEVSSNLIQYQGQPASINIIRDISMRKKMEQERLKLEKLATIGELATMVAHDLRNPLSAIRNASFHIRNTCPKIASAECNTALEMLGIIEQQTVFANNIVSDLLDYAILKPLQKKRQSVNRILENSLPKGNVPENIMLETNFAENLFASVDDVQLERVFLNMIKNAVQAMPNGGKLEITTRETRNNVEIVFTDNGVGIPKENFGKLFQPLFSTKPKGIGMGLCICKKVIEQHSGSIEVKSKIAQGTSFTIKLPKEKRVIV